MIVYCGSETCIHCEDGICTNKFDTGVEAISLVETLGGEMICSDQKDRVLEYGDQDTACGGMMPAT